MTHGGGGGQNYSKKCHVLFEWPLREAEKGEKGKTNETSLREWELLSRHKVSKNFKSNIEGRCL